MRLIDADALIETIENVCCKPCKEQKHDYNGVRCRACQYGDEIDDIDSFHTAEPPYWIPCSERLPEKEGHYLCSFEKPNRIDRIYIDLAYWTGGRWYGYAADAINAWMPLPVPYKEGEE